jgi:putative nucleotidyltransferase with HDIG domain
MMAHRPDARTSIPWHRRLEARVLLCITLVAGLSLETALLAAHRIVTGHSMSRSVEDLQAARATFYRLANQRAEFASAQCRLIVELPVFRANIDLGDPATVNAMAEEYRGKLQAAFCIVTDARGRWLGQPGWPGHLSAPPSLTALLRAAQAGQPGRGYVAAGRKLFLVASEPARFGEEVLGTLTAGYPLDDALAGELARMTGCEVGFLFDQRLCASSLPRLRDGAPETQRLTVSEEPRLTDVGGARYLAGTSSLTNRPAAREPGRLVLLQAWRPTQQFLDHVAAALAAVLGIAFAISLACGLLFSRRVTRPLREIVEAAEDVAAGHWERRAPEVGTAEVSVMASAFNHMTVSLRHWHREAQSHAERLAETLEQVREAHTATLQALSRALDARDNETEGHSIRVTHYAMRIAEEMGLDEETRSAIHWGALLHDIGKIGVGDAILHKPGKLTEEEMRVMQRHCELGLEIVREIPYLERAADVIRCHHERYDGRGYPGGLAGEEIPLAARVFAVADTLDAITSDRPYRRGSSFTVAMTEILRHSGSQFDPQVVAALRTVIEELRQWRHPETAVEDLPLPRFALELAGGAKASSRSNGAAEPAERDAVISL